MILVFRFKNMSNNFCTVVSPNKGILPLFASKFRNFANKGMSKFGWHSLRYFLFSLSDFIFQPSGVEGLNLTSKESEEASDSDKVDFNPLGLTGAEISALKVQK